MNIGSRLLVGFQGRYGDNIDCLSPLFLKPTKSLVSNFTYTSKPIGGIKPAELNARTFDNRYGPGLNYQFGGANKREIPHTWTQGSATIFGASMKIKASIREVLSVEAGCN